MDAEVLAIGNEVLSGVTVNSNAASISRLLADLGFTVVHHEVVRDEREAIVRMLKDAIARSPLVICSGGLGPTLDDITRASIAGLFDCDLAFNEEVAADLARRYGDRPISLEDQATIPSKAKPFLNTVGTAPGLCFETTNNITIFLPGVPIEMREMMRHSVLPYLQEHYASGQVLTRRKLHFCLVTESRVDQVVREVDARHPNVDFGIYPGQGVVSVHLVVKTADAAEAEALLKSPIQELETAFPGRYFEAPSGRIEEAVHHLLTERKETLSTAESCTGGAIAAAITGQAGASKYFEGSVVSYSNAMKQALLGVPVETLEKHGAVSEETVCEMAQGACERLNTDFSIAVSGIAGPTGGTEEKPVGTVWMAVGRKGQSAVPRLLKTGGNREAIIHRSVQVALSHLWTVLTGNHHE